MPNSKPCVWASEEGGNGGPVDAQEQAITREMAQRYRLAGKRQRAPMLDPALRPYRLQPQLRGAAAAGQDARGAAAKRRRRGCRPLYGPELLLPLTKVSSDTRRHLWQANGGAHGKHRDGPRASR